MTPAVPPSPTAPTRYVYVRDQYRIAWHATAWAIGLYAAPALCGESAPKGRWDDLRSRLLAGDICCPDCRARLDGTPSLLEVFAG